MPINNIVKGIRGIVSKGINFTPDGKPFAKLNAKNVRIGRRTIKTKQICNDFKSDFLNASSKLLTPVKILLFITSNCHVWNKIKL